MRPRPSAVLSVVVLGVCLLVAPSCRSPRLAGLPGASRSSAPTPAAVGTLTAEIHPHLARFEAFEVAVERPGGPSVAAEVRAAFRDALRAGFLERGYSPLDSDYVDAVGAGVAQPGLTFPVRSMITGTSRASDGGVLVSGWVGLVAPPDAGGEEVTLYLAEVRDLAVPPVAGTAARDGGAETGRRLAEALLRRLPAR